jgi:opacity protein-like surface antigen
MIRKTVISSIIFLSTSSVIFAKSTSYVGGGLGMGGYSQGSGLNGVSANLFAGKGKFIDKDEKIYVGGELGAGFTRRSSYNNSVNVNASVIPGLMITKDTMVYGRLGLTSSYFPKKMLSFATQVGAGVQTNVAKNWLVRTEYVTSSGSRSGEIGAGLVYKFE